MNNTCIMSTASLDELAKNTVIRDPFKIAFLYSDRDLKLDAIEQLYLSFSSRDTDIESKFIEECERAVHLDLDNTEAVINMFDKLRTLRLEVESSSVYHVARAFMDLLMLARVNDVSLERGTLESEFISLNVSMPSKRIMYDIMRIISMGIPTEHTGIVLRHLIEIIRAMESAVYHRSRGIIERMIKALINFDYLYVKYKSNISVAASKEDEQ